MDNVQNLVWDTGVLAWVRMQQPILHTDLPITVTIAANSSVNVNQFGGTGVSLGQKTMASSMPIVVASDQSAIPISAASLPLPTGAATSANQTNASQKTQIVDGSGNVASQTSNALDVNLKTSAATVTVSGTVTANAGTNLNTSALATSANQTNGTQQTQVTDGASHFQPTGDAIARAIITEMTDGTNILGTTSHPVVINVNNVPVVIAV